METRTIERQAPSPQPHDEFEIASSQPSMRNEGSTSACVAMTACSVVLLLMLSACSPPVLALQASDADVRTFNVAVPIEKLTVAPSPEDVPSPVKGRWQRFEAALNAGRVNRNFRIIESATNDGVRMSCHEPCLMNCCASSGDFSPAGQGFGR